MEKVILTTGGTGGHIFPALAVAQALRDLNPDVKLLFIGGNYGPEKEMVSRAGIPFEGLDARGILGRGWRALPALTEDFKAVFKAMSLIRSFGPCAVAAFGGYASFAPAVAAAILHKPLLLHEQNAIAGMSNKILSRFARQICLSLPNTEGIGRPGVVTGNPVRSEMANAGRQKNIPGKRLLILGGSQGAHALNQWVVENLSALQAAAVELRHQTGTKDLEWVRTAYAANGYDPQCAQAFIHDMSSVYAWADMALCRSGASTVAELCLAELPAILVPFPSAIRDHQTINARSLEQAGAAKLLPEADLSQALPLILDLLVNREALGQMSRATASLARPDAAMNVAREIQKLCKEAAHRKSA